MFLRDQWYVGAWSDEVGRVPLGRTILGEDIVFYRTEAGKPVALANHCAHRRLPLTEGRLRGDTIECGYHGLVYDESGRCVKIPGQEAPRGIGVRSYPVIERDQFVSVWIGDHALADPASAISFPRLSDANWGCTKVRLHIGCNYLLILGPVFS
jgi:vanillate O-demethylase monooxygenase subunit